MCRNVRRQRIQMENNLIRTTALENKQSVVL